MQTLKLKRYFSLLVRLSLSLSLSPLNLVFRLHFGASRVYSPYIYTFSSYCIARANFHYYFFSLSLSLKVQFPLGKSAKQNKVQSLNFFFKLTNPIIELQQKKKKPKPAGYIAIIQCKPFNSIHKHTLHIGIAS